LAGISPLFQEKKGNPLFEKYFYWRRDWIFPFSPHTHTPVLPVMEDFGEVSIVLDPLFSEM